MRRSLQVLHGFNAAKALLEAQRCACHNKVTTWPKMALRRKNATGMVAGNAGGNGNDWGEDWGVMRGGGETS